MIMLIGGLLGSGKTLLMTILGKAYKDDDKYKIYSNYKTSFSKMVHPKELMKFDLKKCVLLCDEIYTFFFSRTSFRQENRLLGFYFKQTRKLDVHVIGTSQIIGHIDNSLRYIADHNIMAESIKRVEYVKGLPKFTKTGFNYSEVVAGELQPLFYLPYNKAKPFFRHYNTNEVITPFEIEEIDIKKVLKIYEESEKKNIFVAFIRAEFPQITVNNASICYDLLKFNRVDKAEKLLNRVV